MAAFADTAFGKDTAFASTAFDFGVSGGGGAPGGVSGYLGEFKKGGGNLLREQRHLREEQDRFSEAFRLSQQIARDDEDIVALLHAIMQLYD